MWLQRRPKPADISSKNRLGRLYYYVSMLSAPHARYTMLTREQLVESRRPAT